MKNIKLLAISGSLREASYNTSAINALKILAPIHVEIRVGEIGQLPLFNPDLENERNPPLEKLKSSLSASSGLIVATPEYAHGISGPLKNALDWLVSALEFPDTAIMLINTSPRAHHAQDQLREVLLTMSGDIVEGACVTVPLLGSGLDCDGIVKDDRIAVELRTALTKFCEEICVKSSKTRTVEEQPKNRA